MPITPLNSNPAPQIKRNAAVNPQPTNLKPQTTGIETHLSIAPIITLAAISPGLAFAAIMTGCTTFIPGRPNPDAGSEDAPTDTNQGDVLSSDVIQSDVMPNDVIQSDAVQSDVLQSDGQTDSLQSDAIQQDAQVDGPHCGYYSETDNWSGTQTNLDSTTISGSLILAPFQTSGSYLKIWDLGSSNNNIGSGATLTFNANVPAGTGLTVSTCTSSDGSACTNWLPLNGNQISSLPDQYLHVKFDFSSTSTSLTPQLNDYSVNYCVN